MLKITHGIDRLSEWVGITVRWFFVVAVVISAGNAISRRVFDISSNAFLELQWYLFAAGVLLGAAYVLLKDGHVRVDFVSTKLSARTNATVDAVALSLFAIPFCLMLIWYSWPMFEIAWRTGEMSSNAGGLTRWPVLLCLPVGFALLLLQVCAEIAKRMLVVLGKEGGGAWLAGSRIAAAPRGVLMLEGFLVANFVPLMFVGLLVFLLSGIPVAFALIGTGLTFGVLGMELGLFSPSLFSALSYRIYGIVQNETLLAVPFFTLMGLLLERSRMAEDLLEVVGHVFGPIRGGFAVAVVLVGAMLAATTGVIAAAVISMGLISLPIMLRYGYNRPIAAGVIAASGTLAQIVPPSLVLIVLADQLGRSVGDMYAGAMLPSVILIGLFLVFIAFVAVIRPHWVPAMPVSARIHREPSGSSGHASLLVLLILALLVGLGWAHFHDRIVERLIGREGIAATDEVVIISLMVATVFAYLLACVDLWLRLNWLSRLAKQVTFVMIPPIVLIFLVLGTIFLGIATPTEGGAMGAVGAFVMGVARRRLNLPLLTQAVDSTARLTVFVLFILIGATVFSFAFNAADGHEWVEALFKQLPGGQTGFLIAVCALVFVLGMFIDAFEIAFIVIPILTPVAVSMEVDLLWFGVIIGMILQTSFLTPPFGLALSYLRSVAPKTDGVDRKSGLDVKGVSTAQIYAGCIPFIALQILATAFVIYDPSFVLGPVNSGKAAPVAVDADALMPPSMDTLMPPMSDLSN